MIITFIPARNKNYIVTYITYGIAYGISIYRDLTYFFQCEHCVLFGEQICFKLISIYNTVISDSNIPFFGF